MTPGARAAAAIAVLDAVREGAPAERALTNWARGARYAGSGDRAAVRDHVFAVLRRWRSCAARGGGDTGRALMIGALRDQGIAPESCFTGEGHAPAPLSEAERDAGRPPTEDEARDLPDWLWARFAAALGAQDATATAEALRHRAPVTLRVNARALTREDAARRLAGEGIRTRPGARATMALQVIDGERRIARSALYVSGAIELQDAGSQAAMEALDLQAGAHVLDYCAGGGGKVLALAARLEGRWVAHDAVPRRMADLPARAGRAGVCVDLCETADLAARGPFDAVICDVPCSGSGSWRRAPQAKWDLTPPGLDALMRQQAEILSNAAPLVGPEGSLVYCTCSVLTEENEEIVARFLRDSPGWCEVLMRRWPVCEAGDGFFLAHLRRE